jgi:hypothetical protein
LIFYKNENDDLTGLWQTKKRKFFWSNIPSKFSRIFCPISSGTIANFNNETQLRILDNERMFDPVILNDIVKIF